MSKQKYYDEALAIADEEEELLKQADEELRLQSKLRERVLNHKEERILRSIIAQTDDDEHRMSNAILGILSTGCRSGEFAHLQKKNFNAKEGTMKIRVRICECPHCLRKLEKYWQRKRYAVGKLKQSQLEKARARRKYRLKGLWTAKSKAAYRTLQLNDEAFKILSNIFKEHNEILEIYPSVDSLSWHITKINDIIKDLSYKNFKKVTPHSLRATKLSRIAEETGSPYDVQLVAGHESIDQGQAYIKLHN